MFLCVNASLTGSPTATKLTARQISRGRVCELLGHIEESHYSDVIVAGCETDGSKHIRCATCNSILKTITTKAHGHIAASTYTDVIDETCTKDGSMTIRCTICGEVIETIIIPAHGHKFNERGRCEYCYALNINTASFFSSGGWIAIAVISVVLIGAGITVIVIKKKKHIEK